MLEVVQQRVVVLRYAALQVQQPCPCVPSVQAGERIDLEWERGRVFDVDVASVYMVSTWHVTSCIMLMQA